MVNIAFPYKETDASAMDMALGVLQGMAENGNGYIRACQSLLSKIRSTIKPLDPPGPASLNGQTRMSGEPPNEIQTQSENNLVSWLPGDQNQGFNMDLEGDPAVWAEVLDSINIDMDRQWVEMALQRGELLEPTQDMV